jgi:plastocyanin
MRLLRPLGLGALALSIVVPVLAGQSLLYRPPNLGGTWVPPGGVLQFNFMHRFYVTSSAASNKVINYPTFTFALGLGHDLTLGTHYATNSSLVDTTPARPNEFELYGRFHLGADEGTNGIAIGITPAYNTAARSVDVEVSVDYTAGRLTVSGAGRAFQKAFGTSEGDGAVAGGLTLRLNNYVSLGGDVAKLLGSDSAAAWSAGLNFVIPGSPHTFSLHASNAISNTIQGASSAFSNVTYGFEFTIPIHFSRFAPWFGKGARPPANVPVSTAAATVTMRRLKFAADSVEIRAGQSVRWVNQDMVDHTVTFEQPGPTSSGMMRTNGTFIARFEEPGVYRYHCSPHPDMRGVIIVK